MTKIIVYVAIAVVVFGSIAGYLAIRDKANVNKGIEQQKASDTALANQNIATRRATDETFDRMDAIAVCKQFGLTWRVLDGKSYCDGQ